MKLNNFLGFFFTILAILVIIYGAFWELTKPVSIEGNCDGYSLFLFPDQDKVDTEVGKGDLVKLRVINAGSFGDNYKVSLNGPEWAVIKPESFSLKSEEAKTLFLYVSPILGTEGKYDIEINVESKCVNESQKVEVGVLKK
jgi:hypothetical protein